MSDQAQTSGADDYSQDTRLLAIDTPLGPNTALLTTLEGEDVLSRCFRYRVSIETEQSDSAIQSLLGVPVTLWLRNDDPELRRPIHGHVRWLRGQGLTARGTRVYQMEVVPRLWFLSCTSDCRIFQNQSIPDILQTIFADQGLVDVEFRIVRADYPTVEYCVQHQETALDFVSRLMEHLGLFYWHEHSADRHLLVIADRNAAAALCQPASVTVSPLSGDGELQTLDVECMFRPGRWTLNDYDFESPTKLLQVNAPTTLTVPRMVNHEMYEYPGKFLDQDTGRRLSRLRIELEEAQQRRIFGTGRCVGFDPGRRFTVGASRGERGATYLLAEVRHHATAPGAETDGAEASYTNDFVAIPAEVPFRPERLTPKPFVRGLQTATVVGPPGENIFCDPFGRVRVQFHWDRRGQRNDQSSCWMRVSQTRAGSFYGSLVIPHVGHEVIVSFVEGDPDRPLITGTVNNSMTMPPVVLPFDKDKTIQRDHGNNRMIMQGKPGQEHLSVVSPRRVNVFSAAEAARPLSASATTTVGDTTPYTFEGNAVSPYNDPTGLYELWESWYLLNNPNAGTIPTASGGSTSTQSLLAGQEGSILSVAAPSVSGGGSTPAVSTPNAPATVSTGVADTADTCDINSFTTGKMNSLSIGNSNMWVWATYNEWVNGAANEYVGGESYTEIHGGSNSVTYEYAASTVLGDSTSTVTSNSNSFVGGLSVSAVIGVSLAMVYGGTVAMNDGGIVSINTGYAVTINDGWSFTADNTVHTEEAADHEDEFLVWNVTAGAVTNTFASYALTVDAMCELTAATLSIWATTLAVDVDANIAIDALAVTINGATVDIN